MVNPVPQPTTPAAPTGVWYGASSVPPASGVSGVGYFNGPWVIETQKMDIQYVRVPDYSSSAITHTLTDAAQQYRVIGTQLVSIVNAEYTKTSSTDAYPVSGEYSQPQKFLVDAVSSDIYGQSYGTLDGSSLGPMGRILTEIPYYRRRMMTASEENGSVALNLISSSIEGATFQLGSSSLNNFQFGWQTDQTNNFGEFPRWGPRLLDKGTMVAANDNRGCRTGVGDNYYIAGTYSTGAESLIRMINFIDSTGSKVTDYWLEFIPSSKPFGERDAYHQQPDTWTGLSLYDKNRHDYT